MAFSCKIFYKCDCPTFRVPYSGVFKPYSDVLKSYSSVFLQKNFISPHTGFKEPYNGVFKPYSDVLKPYSGVFLQNFFISVIASYSGCPIVAFLSPIVTF